MDMIQLSIALILFTIAQLATVGGAVLMSRSEIRAMRAEFAEARKGDNSSTALKIDAVAKGVERIEKQLEDIARAAGNARRATDHTTRS